MLRGSVSDGFRKEHSHIGTTLTKMRTDGSDHRMTEAFRLEGTSWDGQGQPSLLRQGRWSRLSRTTSSQVLCTSTDGDSATSLGNLVFNGILLHFLWVYYSQFVRCCGKDRDLWTESHLTLYNEAVAIRCNIFHKKIEPNWVKI